MVLFHTIVGVLLGISCMAVLCINVLVLYAMVRGGLLRRSASPVYVISSQVIIADCFMILVHLGYFVPSMIQQSFLFPAGISDWRLGAVSTLFMVCWYHTSLSHIFLAINRFFVVVFYRWNVFTRPRVIFLCVVVYALSFTLAITTQYLTPCCKFLFEFEFYSYIYEPSPTGLLNYSNEYVDLPLNSTSTSLSILCYSAIVITMRRARSSSHLSDQVAHKRRRREYRYAMQFCAMAAFYTFAWVSFRVFPVIVGSGDVAFFALTVLCVLCNSAMNAFVYLSTNQEIRAELSRALHKRRNDGRSTTISSLTAARSSQGGGGHSNASVTGANSSSRA